MPKHQQPDLRSVHRALADPIRLRLLEAIWERPQSAKELAEWANMPPDRLYYHLTQLEKSGLIQIVEYRPLPGGKVERVYGPTPVEPPGDVENHLEVAHFLAATLEATQVDITAASVAKEEGKKRNIHLQRTAVRLSEAELFKLQEQIGDLIRQAQEKSTDEGVWTRIVVTLVDLQNRNE